jgi:CRISPR-associated protein Cas2
MKTTETLYLVCYDVSGDRARSRLAKRLAVFGLRVQFSVFECVLTVAERDRLVAFVEKTIDLTTDRVCFYPISRAARRKAVAIGLLPDLAIDDDAFII